MILLAQMEYNICHFQIAYSVMNKDAPYIFTRLYAISAVIQKSHSLKS